jgi:hypothetical protein
VRKFCLQVAKPGCACSWASSRQMNASTCTRRRTDRSSLRRRIRGGGTWPRSRRRRSADRRRKRRGRSSGSRAPAHDTCCGRRGNPPCRHDRDCGNRPSRPGTPPCRSRRTPLPRRWRPGCRSSDRPADPPGRRAGRPWRSCGNPSGTASRAVAPARDRVLPGRRLRRRGHRGGARGHREGLSARHCARRASNTSLQASIAASKPLSSRHCERFARHTSTHECRRFKQVSLAVWNVSLQSGGTILGVALRLADTGARAGARERGGREHERGAEHHELRSSVHHDERSSSFRNAARRPRSQPDSRR